MDPIASNSYIPRAYKKYRLRFFIAGIVFLCNLTNQVVWASFASITATSASYYGTTAFGIEMMSLIFMILYIPFSPVSSWILDEKGIRYSILIGSIATFSGSCIKWMSGFSQSNELKYGLCLFGQTVAGIGQPFLCNGTLLHIHQVAPTKVAARWFPVNERIIANGCMTLGIPVGIAVIVGIGPAIVSGDVSKIHLLNLIIMIMTGISFVLSFFTKESPMTLPSASAGSKNLPFGIGLKTLFKNSNYVLLLFIFGFFVGIFNVYITLISQYIVPYGFTEDDAGILGVITIAVGLVSALVVNGILVVFPYTSPALRLCALIATAGTIMFLCGLSSKKIELLYSGSVLIGLGGFPMQAIVLELGVESSWPIAEGTSAGTLYIFSQIFGIIFLFSANALGNVSFYNAFILNVCVCIASTILSMIYRDEKKRLKVETIVLQEASLC